MNIIAQKVKSLTMFLRNSSSLYDIMIECRQNIPQNNETLVTIILDLHEANYQFKSTHYARLFYNLTYVDWHANNNETFLTHANIPDHKKIIEIVLNNITLTTYNSYLLRRISINTKNYNWLDILIEKNYLFSAQILNNLLSGRRHRRNKKDDHFEYINNNFDVMSVFDNSVLTYLIFRLHSETQLPSQIYDKVLQFINNTDSIPVHYFNLLVSTINQNSLINKNKGKQIIIALFNNLIQNISNHNDIYNIIEQKGLQYKYLCKLIIKHLYRESFLLLLLDKNILYKNLDYLFDANQFIVTTQFINKLLLKTDVCKILNDYNLGAFIYDKKNVFNSDEQMIIKFNFDNNTFIEIGNDAFEYVGKLNTIDLFKIFNCIPDNETFKIALNKGYITTVQNLINEYKFVVDDFCLNECIKSKNIKLITMILDYGVKPNNILLNSLITTPTNKVVYFTDAQYKRSIRYRRSNKLKSKKSTIKKSSIVINIVELLIKYGLKIDFYCINLLLSCNEELLNLERFGITYDEDLYFLCYVNEYYPQEYMKKFIIDQNVLKMRHLISEGVKHDKIIDFLKTNNLKLDSYAIEYAIKNKTKFGNELMNIKLCIPSLPTLYKMSLCIKSHWRISNYNAKLFMDYVENNGITKEMMMRQYDIIF